jgi:hypothetical protein
MRWAGQLARIVKKIRPYRDLVGKHEGKRHMGRLSVDGTIIKELILQR